MIKKLAFPFKCVHPLRVRHGMFFPAPLDEKVSIQVCSPVKSEHFSQANPNVK